MDDAFLEWCKQNNRTPTDPAAQSEFALSMLKATEWFGSEKR